MFWFITRISDIEQVTQEEYEYYFYEKIDFSQMFIAIQSTFNSIQHKIAIETAKSCDEKTANPTGISRICLYNLLYSDFQNERHWWTCITDWERNNGYWSREVQVDHDFTEESKIIISFQEILWWYDTMQRLILNVTFIKLFMIVLVLYYRENLSNSSFDFLCFICQISS